MLEVEEVVRGVAETMGDEPAETDVLGGNLRFVLIAIAAIIQEHPNTPRRPLIIGVREGILSVPLTHIFPPSSATMNVTAPTINITTSRFIVQFQRQS